MKIIAYIKSSFTDNPQLIKDEWYYRRGKIISKYELFLESYKKDVAKLKNRITNEPNIYIK